MSLLESDLKREPTEDEVARTYGYESAEAMRRGERAREDQVEMERQESQRAKAVADVDLESCEYDELQRLALLCGVRANQSPRVLVREIRKARGEL